MIEYTNESFSFSFGDEEDLKVLLEDINSSYSAEVSCSFENLEEMDFELLNIKDLKNTVDLNKRKGIPEEIKELSNNFINRLFDNYKSGENKVENNLEVSKTKVAKQKSFKKKVTIDNNFENSNGFSNTLTKYTTFYKLGSDNSRSIEKLDSTYTKTSSPNKHVKLDIQNIDAEPEFSLNDKMIMPKIVGNAKFSDEMKISLNSFNFKNRKNREDKKICLPLISSNNSKYDLSGKLETTNNTKFKEKLEIEIIYSTKFDKIFGGKNGQKDISLFFSKIKNKCS